MFLREERMTVRDELFTLQLEQLKHDQKYHRDICILPIHQRINHMALHFSKYSGRIAEYYGSNDARPLNSTIIDTFIISLVSANIMNILLADHIPFANDNELNSLKELGSSLVDNTDYDYRDRSWLLKAIAIPSGRLAKACESLDHIDTYSYREQMVKCTAEICVVALVAATTREIDLRQLAKQRLSEVESNLIFHGYV